MAYVDGFVIPLPKKNLAAYRRMARASAKIWREHGALEYRECVGEDLAPTMAGKRVTPPFPRMLRLRPSETVVFAWIVYRSRAHRDRVNAEVLRDPRIESMMEDEAMPFDVRRMAYGGFRVIVDA